MEATAYWSSDFEEIDDVLDVNSNSEVDEMEDVEDDEFYESPMIGSHPLDEY